MSKRPTPPGQALQIAISTASASPCNKSKRGAVIFSNRELMDDHGVVYGIGNNHPPGPMRCDGSKACRDACNKLCVHAEVAAVLDYAKMFHSAGGCPLSFGRGRDLLHIKVIDGQAVASGDPSCWQCSRQILDARIEGVWLMHESGWHRYTALELHELTLRHHHLPTLRRKGS